MVRNKKAKVELHDDRNMETVVDFGSVNVASSWKDVTLQMMCDFWKFAQEKKDLLEEDKEQARKDNKEIDETKEKYNVTDKDILKAFSDIDPDKIDLLPVELYEQIMGHLSFVVTPYEEKAPSKYIKIDGIQYVINDMEGLKVKEFTDADSVLRSNRYDYPSLLAILCRMMTGTKRDTATGMEWDVNEEYTEEFANRIFDARREMFAKLPISEAMPLISFFLLKSIVSKGIFQRYSMIHAHRLGELAEKLGNSLDSMDLGIWSKMRAKRTLRRYKRQIDDILSTSSPT